VVSVGLEFAVMMSWLIHVGRMYLIGRLDFLLVR